MTNLSYVAPTEDSPWGTYLSQVDRVVPYLGHLARWAETLKRPKRTLIVDVPIEIARADGRCGRRSRGRRSPRTQSDTRTLS